MLVLVLVLVLVMLVLVLVLVLMLARCVVGSSSCACAYRSVEFAGPSTEATYNSTGRGVAQVGWVASCEVGGKSDPRPRDARHDSSIHPSIHDHHADQ